MDPQIFVNNGLNKVTANEIARIIVENDFKTILRNPAYSNCDLKLTVSIYYIVFVPPGRGKLVVDCVGN